ncbi:hypothetical protein [Nocardia thraciensis]
MEEFGADLGGGHGVEGGEVEQPVFVGVEFFELALEALVHGAGGGLFVAECGFQECADVGDEGVG